MKPLGVRLLASAGCLLVLAGCTSSSERASEGGPVVQLGAPGESASVLTEEQAEQLADPSFTDSDTAFVQNMIPHHQQALEMTALIADRTDRKDLPLLAKRMDVSQTDEIAQMEAWLEKRGQDQPEGDHHHGDERDAAMPGMLTEEQLAELAAADGADFDRLFLQYMIRHHEGAILMVEQLFAEGQGGQESGVFQIAQHISSDQAVEIARMKDLLQKL